MIINTFTRYAALAHPPAQLFASCKTNTLYPLSTDSLPSPLPGPLAAPILLFVSVVFESVLHVSGIIQYWKD